MSSILDSLNSQIFTGQLHTKFSIHLQGMDPLTVELVEVNERNTPRTEAFSLLFRGPASPRLNQQIHDLEHAKLGRFPLFLTAVAGDSESITYEAVFHRLRKDP